MKIWVIILSGLIYTLFISCRNEQSQLYDILNNQTHSIETHPFSTSKNIKEKIGTIPDIVLGQLKIWDNDSTYSSFNPDSNQIDFIVDLISQLPPLNRKALEERLAGIYFIQGFKSNGMTDFVRDSANMLHFYFVFDSDLLNTSIKQAITKRLYSCFKQESNNIDIEIETSDSIPALFATLLHESTHAVDLVYQITPFLYPVFSDITINKDTHFIFTLPYWQKYSKPQTEYDFWGRDSITFYGFNGGPKLSIDLADQLFLSFENSPFASLYASMNWAEDLAEMVTWYHLVKYHNCTYSIVVKTGEKVIFQYEPMKNKNVIDRVQNIVHFYNKYPAPPPAVGLGL